MTPYPFALTAIKLVSLNSPEPEREHDPLYDEREAEDEALNALRQDGVAAVVHDHVHEPAQREEQVDGGVADVGHVLVVGLGRRKMK